MSVDDNKFLKNMKTDFNIVYLSVIINCQTCFLGLFQSIFAQMHVQAELVFQRLHFNFISHLH